MNIMPYQDMNLTHEALRQIRWASVYGATFAQAYELHSRVNGRVSASDAARCHLLAKNAAYAADEEVQKDVVEIMTIREAGYRNPEEG